MVTDDFILGLDNSLGVNKASIDKAEIIGK